MSRKTLLIVAVSVAVLGSAVALYARTRRPAAVTYFTVMAERGPIRNVVNATGVVQTVVMVQVGSQVSGQMKELYADFNSVVKQGQLLARIDPRNLETPVQNARANISAVEARVKSASADLEVNAANVVGAQANLEAARVARDNAATAFSRADELAKKGLISATELENAKANADSARAKFNQAAASVTQTEAQRAAMAAQIDQAKAQLVQARTELDRAAVNLEYTNIYSPVDGVVIARNVDVGQTIAANLQAPTLFSIATDLTRMQLNASIDEADIGVVSAAADVHFTVDAYPSESFTAKVAEIRLSPQTVQNVVTYSVILAIDNRDMRLRPGMTANIAITVEQRDDVLRIPNAALRYTPAGMSRDREMSGSVSSTEYDGAPEADTAAEETSSVSLGPLAPGQKWDAAQKVHFAAPKRGAAKPGDVFVLGTDGVVHVRHVLTGISDGASSEVLSGELKAGERVITADGVSAPAPTRPAQGGGPFGPPPGGGRGGF
ncbi:MAG: efflux RND transporter periplasmic adaptor subunit [Vicinamibacterales bacterium]